MLVRPSLLLPLLLTGGLLAIPPAHARQGAQGVLVTGSEVLRVASATGELTTWPLPPRVEVLSLLAGESPVVVGVVGSASLFVAQAEGDQLRSLSVPAAGGDLVLEALAIADPDGGFGGITWLAGADRESLAVRFAPWDGAAFGPVELVAPPGAGSQLALTAARLGDGGLLLAWSAFDGEDDEIRWSVRKTNGRWSAPADLGADNVVPDVTPALVATPTGALLAWSRYDAGEYRVMTARFTRDRWSEPRFVGGRGTLFPLLHQEGETTLLLYRDVPTGGWAALQLDRTGRVQARAVLSAATSRPIVLGFGREGLRLLGRGASPVTRPWEPMP